MSKEQRAKNGLELNTYWEKKDDLLIRSSRNRKLRKLDSNSGPCRCEIQFRKRKKNSYKKKKDDLMIKILPVVKAPLRGGRSHQISVLREWVLKVREVKSEMKI